MINFYYNPSPNPAKVALLLEELELPYNAVPVDARRGDQFAPAFLAINPNGKVPALTDGDATVFDSNAILLFLAERSGKFLPPQDPALRAELLSWLMFVASGVGPFCGQAVHFKHYAPDPKAYALNRYMFEAERHWRLVDQRLQTRRYMLGDAYTIVDMAVWGWARAVPFIFGDDGWSLVPNLKRLFDEISARPAADRVSTLFARDTFQAEMDDAARRTMFPHLSRLAPA